MPNGPDVIEKIDVKSLAENEARETLRFREAFRDHNGDNAGSEMSFVDIEDSDSIDESEFVEVAEGAQVPAADFEYSENKLVYSKYGVTVQISDETLEDNRLATALDAEREAMRAESRRMDGIAYEVLSGAAASSGVGNADGDLGHDELIQARAWHRSDAGGNYDPDIAFVEPQGAASLLIEQKDRHTQSGDNAARTGKIGEIGGMEILEANTGRLGEHDAILVDSDRFGFESTKYEKDVEEERDARSKTTDYVITDRLGWVATDGAAAAHVDG